MESSGITFLGFENREADPEVVTVIGKDGLQDAIELFLLKRTPSVEESSSFETSPWINRYGLTEEYVLVPKTTGCWGDVEKTTCDRFVVYKVAGNVLGNMGYEDIAKIKDILAYELTPEGMAKRKENVRAELLRETIFQVYRKIYCTEKDAHIAKLRDALINDEALCLKWVEEIKSMMSTGKSHSSTEEEVFFKMFLSSTHVKSVLFAASYFDVDPYNEDSFEFLTLRMALKNKVVKEELIRALEPESIAIERQYGEFARAQL